MTYTTRALAEKIHAKGLILHNKSSSIIETLEAHTNEAAMNEICHNLATKINNELIFVKNKLRPLMNDIVIYINSKLEEVQTPSPTAGYNIKIFENNHLLDELYKQRIISPRRDPHMLTTMLSVPLPDSDDILLQYFTHPTTSIDMYVEPIRSKLGIDGLKAVFEKYFSNLSETNPNIANMGANTLEKVDEYILIYVAANNFLDTRPGGVGGEIGRASCRERV